MDKSYIHGVSSEEQMRLALLNRLTNPSFIRYLEINAGDRVCDFGCGTGLVMRDIATNYLDVTVTGVERSVSQWSKAVENNKGIANVKLINEDIMRTNLPDNHFDVTYCRYVLEHNPNPVEVVQEMVRITKPNGKIVIQENDLQNIVIYPEIPGYTEVKQQFCRLQEMLGGDPYIGRKLFSILKEAGLEQLQYHMEPEIFTEDEAERYAVFMNNSYSILLSAQEELIARSMVEPTAIENVLDAIKTRADAPRGVYLFYWNRIKAFKQQGAAHE